MKTFLNILLMLVGITAKAAIYQNWATTNLLPAGAVGQVLTGNGVGSVPTFQAASGGLNSNQVVGIIQGSSLNFTSTPSVLGNLVLTNVPAANVIAIVQSGSLNFTSTPAVLGNPILTNAPATNSVVYFSGSGGGNIIADMYGSPNAFPGQLGVTWVLNGNITNASAALWASGPLGMGSNTFVVPLSLYGGFDYFGMPFWITLTNDVGHYRGNNQQGFYWGYGPRASKYSTAWPNGPSSSSFQPYLNIVNANGFAGGAAIDLRSGTTNSGFFLGGGYSLVGTNGDGAKDYVPQYGLAILQISPDYVVQDPFKNGESEDGAGEGGYVFIGSTASNSWYFTDNGARPGDSIPSGQIPFLVLDTSTFSIAHPLFRVPKQTPNVWMPFTNAVPNPAWRDSLLVDEFSGSVWITNGPLTVSNLFSSATNVGAVVFGGASDLYEPIDINMPLVMDLPTATFGSHSSLIASFDYFSNHRLGFAEIFGQYPSLMHAAGSSFAIAQAGVADLTQISSVNQSYTNELIFNANSTVEVPKFLILDTGAEDSGGGLVLTNSQQTTQINGNTNGFYEANVQNFNNGTNASSDVVATAPDGSESLNFIDMGINSGTFFGFIGVTNDGYLYVMGTNNATAPGGNLWIGTAQTNKVINFIGLPATAPGGTLNGETNILTITPSNAVFNVVSLPGNPTATFSVVNTNWILGGKYSFPYPVIVNAKAALTETGVAGQSDLELEIIGNTTNQSAETTLITSLAGTKTNTIVGFIPANATFDFTNRSAGAGDSAAVSGGQYIIQ